jgi:hypothetical protein
MYIARVLLIVVGLGTFLVIKSITTPTLVLVNELACQENKVFLLLGS